MELEIEVTEHDIYSALPTYTAATCPVARALRRVTGRVWFVLPFTGIVPGMPGYYAQCGEAYKLPEHAAKWVKAFDISPQRRDIRPLKFTLEVPGVLVLLLPASAN